MRDGDPRQDFAIGHAVEDGEAVEYVVYALREDDDADDVAEEVERMWGENGAAEAGRIEVDGVETEGDDAVVVRIVPDEAGETERLLEVADFPFLS